jgi:hypothetical protein
MERRHGDGSYRGLRIRFTQQESLSTLRRCTLLNAARLWIAFNTKSLQPYQRDPFGRLGASHPPTSCRHSLKAMRSSTRLNLRGAVEQELRRVRPVYSFSKCLEAPVEADP